MASPSSTPDTPITLKVNFNGTTRRFKVPLRELTITHLEDKLRSFLQIPIGTTAKVERYSDSAATYVLLDRTDISVYKQLFRAAKAKQKLKLRVTTTAAVESSPPPKPATVEDAPEPLINMTTAPAAQASSFSPSPTTSDVTTKLSSSVAAPQTPEGFPQFIEQWRARGMPRIKIRQNAEGREIIDFAEPPVTHSDTEVDTSSRAPQSYDASLLDQPRPVSPTVEPCERETEVETAKETPALEASDSPRRPFTVACNSCDRPVPDAHFHCSTCDDGDFDLCQECVDQGISCHDDHHWLIKRTIQDGHIRYSTTQVAPKKAPKPAPRPAFSALPIRLMDHHLRSQCVPSAAPSQAISLVERRDSEESTSQMVQAARTCNSCIRELPERDFVHCTTCDDYDLCKECFAGDRHGHHPKHAFAAAEQGASLEPSISSRMPAGRDMMHNAICDGCDKYVRGIRHKCLDCPDWDYCSDCMQTASFVHPNHRFVAVYEPLANPKYTSSKATHHGICCDGPLCAMKGDAKYITGERYKCAVCHDTDFCASCEANPSNSHNKTHPLIKFKTPVRHVSVTTTGEHENGRRLPQMGDRLTGCPALDRIHQRATSPRESIAATPVQTVVDVHPSEQQTPEPVKTEEQVEKQTPAQESQVQKKQTTPAPDLVAVFKHDTIADGTVMPPNHTFSQTWVLRNEGSTPWPAGCSVKFVGGDYMGAVDPAHPAGIHELVSASESTVCYNALNPGQEFPFTVLMRTPDRDGKVISYWRLTDSEGVKFGHKLWCDVVVEGQATKPKEVPEAAAPEEQSPKVTPSQMIIPTLEHESPMSSMHEESQRSDVEVQTETDTLAPSTRDDEEDFEVCGEAESWAEESDDEAFMTDEEYDILDASDEEYLSEQHAASAKK